MSGSVKPRRRYESPRRREQAAATRQAILEAAERLFAKRGYVGTSVAEIADEARVALKTVYAVFGTKAEVLRALWERFQREFYELGVRGIVETLERDGVLAADLTTAADIGWTLTHPDLYQLLVRQRGWSPEAYERWLAETLCAQLIKDRVAGARRPRSRTRSRRAANG